MESEKPLEPQHAGINNLSAYTPKKKYDRHNLAKLKILTVCARLERDRRVVNSVRIATLTKKTNNQVQMLLNHYSQTFPYLKAVLDPNRTDKCLLKYKLTKQGKSVLKKLTMRYNNSLDLNLKEKDPEKISFVTQAQHIEKTV